MWFVDILIALVAPLFIPVFNQFVDSIKKPYIILSADQKKHKSENISIFWRELPTAFIANAIWGMTYKTLQLTEQNFVWIITYAFIAILSFFPMMYSHTEPKERKYKVIIGIFGVAIIILTIIRVCMAYTNGNVQAT